MDPSDSKISSAYSRVCLSWHDFWLADAFVLQCVRRWFWFYEFDQQFWQELPKVLGRMCRNCGILFFSWCQIPFERNFSTFLQGIKKQTLEWECTGDIVYWSKVTVFMQLPSNFLERNLWRWQLAESFTQLFVAIRYRRSPKSNSLVNRKVLASICSTTENQSPIKERW